MSLATSNKVIFESIEQILSARLSASALLKTINNLAHTTAKKHKSKQFDLKTDAQKTAYINDEHEFGVSLNYNKNMSLGGALKRMSESKFWRKNIEKQVLKNVEYEAFTQKKLGHNRKEKCVSNRTLEYFDLKKEQTDRYLETCQWPLISTHLWPIKLTHPCSLNPQFFASVDSFHLPA